MSKAFSFYGLLSTFCFQIELSREFFCKPILTYLLSYIINFLFPDVGSNNSGYYELSAVLTHRGRSSSSGHYVAWVRKKGGK